MNQEPLQLPPKGDGVTDDTVAIQGYKRPQPDPNLPDPGRYEKTKYNKPRHAKERNPIWSYIALGGYFAAAGFIGAFLGTLLANIL